MVEWYGCGAVGSKNGMTREIVYCCISVFTRKFYHQGRIYFAAG